MNLSKDDLVKLASGIKINKKVLEKKSKNELVEFRKNGINFDRTNNIYFEILYIVESVLYTQPDIVIHAYARTDNFLLK